MTLAQRLERSLSPRMGNTTGLELVIHVSLDLLLDGICARENGIGTHGHGADGGLCFIASTEADAVLVAVVPVAIPKLLAAQKNPP